MNNRGQVVVLACGDWLRVRSVLVESEEWGGLISRQSYECPTHGESRVVQRSFWEWHVVCHSCGYGAWHGVDAEKARADYQRHKDREPTHELRCGWDGFVGKLDDSNAQGTLLISDDERAKQIERDEQQLAAIKRAAVKRRAPRQVTPRPAPVPRSSTPVSFADLMQSARRSGSLNPEHNAPPGTN